MGLLDILTGRKMLMSYQININTKNFISVDTTVMHGLSNKEYLRLWAFYFCKVVYNLGYPNNKTADLIIQALHRVISSRFDKNTNCIERANLASIVSYTDRCRDPIILTGKFYATESNSRSLITDFPLNVQEHHIVSSTFALLQYAINKCSGQDDLDIAWKLIFFHLVYFDSGSSISMSKLTSFLPETAFSKALQIDIDEILEEETEKPSRSNVRDRFLQTYQEVSANKELSVTALKYISKKYPLNSESQYNQYLGGFFIVGYNIRATEEKFSEELGFNIFNIKPSEETESIICSETSRDLKIERIAEYKEHNNETCNLGPEVEDYSILGLDQMNEFFAYILTDYIKGIGFMDKFNLTENLTIELSGRNAALGYCFRLAESIVDADALASDLF